MTAAERAALGRGNRWDVQVVRRGGGERASAVDAWAAADEQAMGDLSAVDELERDKYAPTTRGPKGSRQDFVEGLVLRARGWVYPLVPEGLQSAAACLKRGRYRAPSGYLGELKRSHVKQGGSWTDHLKLEMKDCVRSVIRGMGPPTRAPEVRVSLAARADGGYSCLLYTSPSPRDGLLSRMPSSA